LTLRPLDSFQREWALD